MEIGREQAQEIFEEIDWENFLQSIPDPVLLFTDGLDLVTEPPVQESTVETPNPSPNWDPSWFGDIEHFLLEEEIVVEDNRDFSEDFFSGILLNASDDKSGEVSFQNEGILSPQSNSVVENEENEKSDASEENNGDEDAPMTKKQKR